MSTTQLSPSACGGLSDLRDEILKSLPSGGLFVFSERMTVSGLQQQDITNVNDPALTDSVVFVVS